MNISIISAKTAVLGGILLAVFSAVFVANAAVTLTSATINGDSSGVTVAPGATVTIDLSAGKTPASNAGCNNNWVYTRVSVDGDVVVNHLLDSVTGTTASDSVDFDAPLLDGEYEVLVEVVGGLGSDVNVTCTEGQVWDSRTFDLTVFTAVPAFIQVLDLDPVDEVRVFGDTEPLTYTAEVEIGGNPDVPHLQCVVFDIFRGDSWDTVAVDFDEAGIYDEEDGISFTYDISGYATGTYPVNVIALDTPCDDLPDDFDSADYLGTDESNTMETTLTIVDPVDPVEPTYCVYGNIWNDTNNDGEFSEGEEYSTEWGVQITNGEVTENTTTDGEGGYEFCVPEGEWTITQVSPEGWTYSYPSDGEWVITLPIVPEVEAVVTFLDQIINFLIPTAHAAVAPNNGPLNFGVFQRPTTTPDADDDDDDNGGSGSSATRVGSRSGGGSSSSDNDDDEDTDTPEGQVLGEATSVMPIGAPATGAGGTAPVAVNLPSLLAILSTARGIRK